MKKKNWQLKMTRRQVLKAGMIGGAGMMLPLRFLPAKAFAEAAIPGLSDPADQPKFANAVPDALMPGFKYTPDNKGRYRIKIGTAIQQTGLWDNPADQNLLDTPVWGYSDYKDGLYTWPGRTFEIMSSRNSGPPVTEVYWTNNLDPREVSQHLLPVDTSLHWCYSLPGYTNKTISRNGVPIITHLHGGHTDYQFDGNPEFFYTYNNRVIGPQWERMGGGNFNNKFMYDNDVPAGNLWYHDHALGITRLNVYAGLAGFYFVRDQYDTGLSGNVLHLPAWPYEKAYAIQDRMFRDTGELFYPAFPGDPYYADFINGEGAILPPDIFPGGGPTALAEFFGDHMVVNGKIWPYEEVEPRKYRMHLLNGTDSRFMVIQFWEVPEGETNFDNAIQQLDFTVIGSDQGLATSATTVNSLLSEPGSRYDIIVDFNAVTSAGNRVIMKNIGGDEPFGGDIPGPTAFDDTDKIMAFDVVLEFGALSGDPEVGNPRIAFPSNVPPYVPGVTPVRKVALFEGKDEFGRLQPLLGTAEPASDYSGSPINWPDEEPYISAGLTGPMEGSIAWHSPTTENPALNTTERWEVWNATGDAHPVHLHLVHFEVEGRQMIQWDSRTNEEDRVLDVDPTNDSEADGTYLVTQPVVQHNGDLGEGFRLVNLTTMGGRLDPGDEYVENAPKDMVTALPDQVTFIRAKFDKPGRYVWHCHILSHEDHEMMRVLHVGPGA